MQIFFWFFITILAMALFVHLTMPLFAKIRKAAAGEPAVILPTISTFFLLVFSGFLFIGSIGIYAYIGAPSKIEAKQVSVVEANIQIIIAKIEAHLAIKPEDADGWQVVAPTYLSSNQPEKAFEAFANAIKFGNSNGPNWLGLGKADFQINRGVFGAMSTVAFGKAHEKMPENVEAMFFYASVLQNMGNLELAKTELEEFMTRFKLDAEQMAPLNKILGAIKAQESN